MNPTKHMYRLRTLIGAAALLLTAATAPANAIVGGASAPSGAFPSILSFQHDSEHFCGATLIDAKTAVTAAHCVAFYKGNFTVRSGSLEHASGGTITPVSSTLIHPKYDPSTFNNDIALLYFATPIKQEVSPLPRQGAIPAAGTTLTIAGWGTVSSGGPLPPSLRYADTPVITNSTCNADYGSGTVTRRMFCTETRGISACDGDGGGPVLDSNRVLIGIISRGVGCGLPNRPDVNTRVSTYTTWIKHHLTP